MVTRPGDLPCAEQSAATVLIEEIEKRTGIRLSRSTSWPAGKVVIAITSQTNVPGWGRNIPQRTGPRLPEMRAEGYRIWVENGKVVLAPRPSESRRGRAVRRQRTKVSPGQQRNGKTACADDVSPNCSCSLQQDDTGDIIPPLGVLARLSLPKKPCRSIVPFVPWWLGQRATFVQHR